MNLYLILTKTNKQHEAFLVVSETEQSAWEYVKQNKMQQLDCELVFEDVDSKEPGIATRYYY